MSAENKREARNKARAAVNKWAIGFASVAWIPGSHIALTAGDFAMVIQLGSIYGVDIDRAAAGTIFATVAAPFVGSKVAETLLDFIPILGWAAKIGVAASVTKALGEALIHYFHDCSPLPE
jgi:uncharacterized protein (DUF697 family)